jgi:hypothetical protein
MTQSLLFLSLMEMVSAFETRPLYRGTAWDLSHHHVLYTETHQDLYRQGRLLYKTVTYRDNSGTVIARKWLNYHQSATTPSFQMTDERLDYIEGFQQMGERWHWFSGPKTRPAILETDLPTNATPVVDAGFDPFIQHSWEGLTSGNAVSFNFGSPREQGFFLFEAKPLDIAKHGGVTTLSLELRLKNRLLRWLLDPIRLKYRQTAEGTIGLVSFEGQTNMTDAEGTLLKARILFDGP